MVQLAVAACVEDEVGGVSLVSGNITELSSVTNKSSDVKFNAGGEWKATCAANWLTFSP